MLKTNSCFYYSFPMCPLKVTTAPKVITPAPKLPQENPLGIRMIPYERNLVEAIDALVMKAKELGVKRIFHYTRVDWIMVEFTYKLWKILFPKTSTQFEKEMKTWKRRVSIRTNHGILKEGEARIQHQLEVPQRLHDMLRAIYPDQNNMFNKRFVRLFAKKLPQFRATEDNL